MRALRAIALTFAVSNAALAQTAPVEPIRIGAILSVTGSIASLGIPERDGALLARKVINERGGIKGRPVELIVEDDASSPDAAVTKANHLLYNRKVAAIVGPTGIAQTVAIGGMTQKENVPIVAFTGLGPPVERERTCVFHLTPAQGLNARALLAYAAEEAKAKRVAVLHDSGYGQVVWNAMKDLGSEFGVTFVSTEKFEIAATDATTQVAKIKASNPEAVIVIGTSAVPFRNLRQLRVGVPIVAVHGSATYDIVKAMGDGADGVVHAEFLIAEDPLPAQREFVELYRKEYGRNPKHFDAAGYDALMSLADAFSKTDGAAGEPLCRAMRRPYRGAMTAYDFSAPDMGGLTLASFTYSRLAKGRFERLTFKPSASR